MTNQTKENIWAFIVLAILVAPGLIVLLYKDQLGLGRSDADYMAEENHAKVESQCEFWTSSEVPVEACKDGGDCYDVTMDVYEGGIDALNFPDGGHIDTNRDNGNLSNREVDVKDENGDSWQISYDDGSCGL